MLLGPSGCGKTITLRMVAGFVPITSGDVRVDGESIAGLPAYRREMGLVFQSYALFPHMNVAGNVAFGLEMRGMARAARAARVAEMLALTRLESFAARFRASCRAGSSNGWRWRGRWRCGRGCCCWTSRFPTWMRRCGRRWDGKSGCCSGTPGTDHDHGDARPGRGDGDGGPAGGDEGRLRAADRDAGGSCTSARRRRSWRGSSAGATCWRAIAGRGCGMRGGRGGAAAGRAGTPGRTMRQVGARARWRCGRSGCRLGPGGRGRLRARAWWSLPAIWGRCGSIWSGSDRAQRLVVRDPSAGGGRLHAVRGDGDACQWDAWRPSACSMKGARRSGPPRYSQPLESDL